MHNFFERHKLIQGNYSLDKIQVDYEIGRGNSSVYTIRINGNNFAMKRVQIKSPHQYTKLIKQINLMQQLSNQSQDIVKYQGYFITVLQINQYEILKYAFILMECAQINLQQLINSRKLLTKRLKKWQLQIIIEFMINTFAKLEQLEIAHCDIKPQNILITDCQKMNLKLCDVGSCKYASKYKNQQSTILGTVPFLAPELVSQSQSNKIVSTNAFKSDVFSFGLVLLYMITFKKFKSNERIQIQQDVYYQVINEWIIEAKQMEIQGYIIEVLKYALQFNELKRLFFSQIKNVYLSTKINTQKKIKEHSELQGGGNSRIETMGSYISNSSPKIIPKTQGRKRLRAKNGFKNKQKESPVNKRKDSYSSPMKSNQSTIEFRKIIYFSQQTKELYFNEKIDTYDKIIVLNTSFVNFKEAQTVVMLKNCDLSVVDKLSHAMAKNLYIEYNGFDGVGIGQENVPTLNFEKIYVNLSEACSLVGGYRGIFKLITCPSVKTLQITLTGSDVSYDQIDYLIDRLISSSVNNLLFCWQKVHLKQNQHYNLIEKISKINLKKLTMLMAQNFIQSEKQMRWPLPINLQSLTLDYDKNFINKLIGNLSIAISKIKLKQLYLNIQSNNLGKGELHMLFKAIFSMQRIQKLMLNISRNKLQDIKYISNVLLQHTTTKITTLQLKMHHVEVPLEKILQLISIIKYLFQFELKTFKISCDRTIKKQLFRKKIQEAISSPKIKIDIFAIDHYYYSICLKKKLAKIPFSATMDSIVNKGLKDLKVVTYHSNSSNRNKQLNSTSQQHFNTKCSNPSINIKQPQIQNPLQVQGLCSGVYKSDISFDNYQCLSCSEVSQIHKSLYFCKWCIENCSHKGHNVIKIFSRTRCACAYSGLCTSNISYKICAQDLDIRIKKRYQCSKCQQILCLSCIEMCKIQHYNQVRQNSHGIVYFDCCRKNGNKFDYIRSLKSK